MRQQLEFKNLLLFILLPPEPITFYCPRPDITSVTWNNESVFCGNVQAIINNSRLQLVSKNRKSGANDPAVP